VDAERGKRASAETKREIAFDVWAIAGATLLVVMLITGGWLALRNSMRGAVGPAPAKVAASAADFARLQALATDFRAVHGRWPKDLPELATPTATWPAARASLTPLGDATGNPYVLIADPSDGSISFAGYGSDRAPGGEGDAADVFGSPLR
jgi:hypothetical protein